MMRRYIYPLANKSMRDIMLAGGKGSSLSRLSEIPHVSVPSGLIVTTEAFRDFILPAVSAQVGRLEQEGADAVELCEKIRDTIRAISLPDSLSAELATALAAYDDGELFAVRSSATAEDLPDASFAGQQDSYLNVSGLQSIQQAILDCFASLYNDRAVAYREKNSYDDRDVQMAVVIQRMVPSQVSGVLFTADPLTADRYTSVVEAVQGLGEKLVSGRVTPYTCHVRQGCICSEGRELSPLEEQQIMELVEIGQALQSFFHAPQDIEWCYRDGNFYIVQTRAITTLFPLPPSHDGCKRLFFSVGHMQMMTDPILPLGMSFFQLLGMFQTVAVGGRLYIDITHDLGSAYGRKLLSAKIGTDPVLFASLQEVFKRKTYLSCIPKGKGSFSSASRFGPMLHEAIRVYRKNDPTMIDAYILRQKEQIQKLRESLSGLTGAALLQAIVEDQSQMGSIANDATGMGMILATQLVLRSIDKTGKALTGEDYLSNRLSKSVDHNITSQMGLALAALSDLARRSPQVIAYLEERSDAFSLDELRSLPDGGPVADGLAAFLQDYGMRATGEIDISKPRFRDDPAQLIPSILANIHSLPVSHGQSMFEQGKSESEQAVRELLELAEKRLGAGKARNLERQISLFRNFVGTREYPKYFWMCRYDVYKQALDQEAERLVQQDVLRQAGDLYYLYLEELQHLFETGFAPYEVIAQRKLDYKGYAALVPPGLMFSDGEVLLSEPDRQIPVGALGGLGVSAGIVEGRARIIRNLSEANMQPGDILVTPYTDPSWTPVFVSITGLVTEVGSMMTHGAVITREYGLPAVVGVKNATNLIPDGARIRINGNEGYVEIL